MRSTISIPGAPGYGEDEDIPTAVKALDVLDAAYHTAHNYPGGVPALAVRMGVSQNTLMHKVSVNINTHHLTLREAVTMQEVTGNAAILQAMASALGYDLVKAIPASVDDPLTLNWQMVAAQAEVQHAIADAFAQGVTRNSLRRCDVRAAEASSAMNNLLGALRAALPMPPGEARK
ncbi:MAG: hypothetical protein Q8R67_05200 [Rhodoferax sp.]|nr:phage regulatory CII family protein [Rhodoferax sp.]MDP3651063.1 hypothetical protein [Rhodoferax sp.]